MNIWTLKFNNPLIEANFLNEVCVQFIKAILPK